MQGLDEKIVLFFQSIRCEPLTLFFKIFIPHEFWIGVAFVLVMYYSLKTKVLRVPFISFVLAWELSLYCSWIASDFFHRPRPYLTISQAVPVITNHGFSFPSGHATLAMASGIVLAHHFPKARRLLYFMVFLYGFSRVYLGVHYLSDVLGGYILGAFLGWTAILLERGILSLAKNVRFGKKALMIIFIIGIITINPGTSQAKEVDEQNQIILLNDSAAALEDSNPELSKSLTQFADEKEKDWEYKNANKDAPAVPVTQKDVRQLQDRIKLLKAAALVIQPTYPLIAKSLDQMVKDINKTIETVE